MESRVFTKTTAAPTAIGNALRKIQEPVNSLSHLCGVGVAIAGWLALLSGSQGGITEKIAFSVYGLSMVLCYVASTALHMLPVSRDWRRLLIRLDHSAIYLFIAGTYTPLCILLIGTSVGWGMLTVVWALALIGVLFKTFYLNAPRWLSAISYWTISWTAFLFVLPLLPVLPVNGVVWLLGGGAFYFFGSFIFYLRRPNPIPGWFGFHEIWHFMVLAGTCCHLVLMLKYVS